ncbi:gamete antigen 27/25, putative [Plasmodium relictum]|uniref:Gamete antigen 27/25, putative n=1 Tax=Plasmodium relictum TaxID=85471 RepID=A0A1J1HF92_PLARL|nr:gamete antigen 27/25, putative [Plasmodium relictum]CRH02722.1 gamete antigen 27/25, putative [Plasmodium relictum]
MISKYFFLLNAIILIGGIFKDNISGVKAAESPQVSGEPISSDRYFMHFREYCTLEFEMTVFSLDHVLGVGEIDEMKKILSDLKSIKKEVVTSARKYHQVVMDDEDSDNMTSRISDRLLCLCNEIKVTDDYYALLKNIFWAEQRSLEDAFIEINKKENVVDRKKLIENINMLKSNFKKYLDVLNIKLSEDQMHNTAMRMSKFLTDVFGLTIKIVKPIPLIPDDGNTPS